MWPREDDATEIRNAWNRSRMRVAHDHIEFSVDRPGTRHELFVMACSAVIVSVIFLIGSSSSIIELAICACVVLLIGSTMLKVHKGNGAIQVDLKSIKLLIGVRDNNNKALLSRGDAGGQEVVALKWKRMDEHNDRFRTYCLTGDVLPEKGDNNTMLLHVTSSGKAVTSMTKKINNFLELHGTGQAVGDMRAPG